MTRKAGFFGRIFKSLNKDAASAQEREDDEVPRRRSQRRGNKKSMPSPQQNAAVENIDKEKIFTSSGTPIDVNDLASIRRHSVFYRHNVGPQSGPKADSSQSTTPSRRRAMSEVSPKSTSAVMLSPRIHRRISNESPLDRESSSHLRPPAFPSHKIVPSDDATNGNSPSDDEDELDALMTPAGAAGNATPAIHKQTTVEIHKRRMSMGNVYLPRLNSGSLSSRATSIASPSERASVGRHEGRSPSGSEMFTPQDEKATKGEGKTRGGQVNKLSKKECKLIVALMSEPRNKKHRNKYVKYLIKKDRLMEAENVFESGLLLHKTDWQLHFQFGVFCYDFLNKPHKAELYLTTALQLNPCVSCVHTHLGILVRRRGNDALAEDHFIDALKLDALDFTALGNLVELLQAENRYEEAYQYLIRTYEQLGPSVGPETIDVISFRHVLSLAEDISAKINVSSLVPEFVRQY